MLYKCYYKSNWRTIMKATTLLYAFFILFGIGGWISNLCILCTLDFQTPYKAEIIRSLGVIPIVGAITGWMIIEDN